MERLIATTLGVFAFVAVLLLGARRGLGFSEVAPWAALVGFVGLVLGRLLFGPLGTALAKESAGVGFGEEPKEEKEEKEAKEEVEKTEKTEDADKPEGES